MKKKSKNILIRADSSSIIGIGHIMRDLALALQYRCDNITFATQNLDGNINFKIKEAGYKIVIIKSNEISELSQLIKKENIDLLIIDNYDIDYIFEKQLKIKHPMLKVMVLDDTYEKHHCDILLNHNLYADSKKYKNLVPKECKLRCGSKYTLLRDEFILEKNRKTIFLAMGGADTANINISILKVLKKFTHIKVNVVTTSANKNLKELQEYTKNHNYIHLHIDSNEIATLMKNSDLAILTPSVIVNEAYFMGTPFLAIKTAQNQEFMYKYLKKRYLVLDEFNEKKLYTSTKKLLKDVSSDTCSIL